MWWEILEFITKLKNAYIFKINGKLPNEATDNLVRYIDIIKNRKEN